jgi:hypothetical protein
MDHTFVANDLTVCIILEVNSVTEQKLSRSLFAH